ncbi:MAG: response regulator [bacterium]
MKGKTNVTGKMMKILLVDDDRDVLDVLSMLFEMDGHTVGCAMNYGEALAEMEGSDYDLVITDYRMPRMHGLYLLEMIKDVNPSIPVIIMTAYQTDEMRREAKKKGADLLLAKPFSYTELQSVIRRTMRKWQKQNGMKKSS